jgi:hypothetical protein
MDAWGRDPSGFEGAYVCKRRDASRDRGIEAVAVSAEVGQLCEEFPKAFTGIVENREDLTDLHMSGKDAAGRGEKDPEILQELLLAIRKVVR